MLRTVKMTCISDTHSLHRELDLPGCDLLIHAGDFTMFSKSAAAILDFNEWLGELPHLHKIIIPGNHEFFLESDPSRRKLISNGTVLIDESIEVMGLKIWGSPVTPLYGGAFGLSSELIGEGSMRRFRRMWTFWSRMGHRSGSSIRHQAPTTTQDVVGSSKQYCGSNLGCIFSAISTVHMGPTIRERRFLLMLLCLVRTGI